MKRYIRVDHDENLVYVTIVTPEKSDCMTFTKEGFRLMSSKLDLIDHIQDVKSRRGKQKEVEK